MAGVLIEKGNLNTDRHTGRTPHEDEGRDQGNAPTSQGMSKMANKPPKARREAWNRYSLTALRRIQPRRQLDLRLLASRM